MFTSIPVRMQMGRCYCIIEDANVHFSTKVGFNFKTMPPTLTIYARQLPTPTLLYSSFHFLCRVYHRPFNTLHCSRQLGQWYSWILIFASCLTFSSSPCSFSWYSIGSTGLYGTRYTVRAHICISSSLVLRRLNCCWLGWIIVTISRKWLRNSLTLDWLLMSLIIKWEIKCSFLLSLQCGY